MYCFCTAGLSPEAAAEVINQPEALMVDMHWLPVEMLTPEIVVEDSDDEAGAAEGEDQAGQERQQQPREQTMTLLQLAHVSAVSMGRVGWLCAATARY